MSIIYKTTNLINGKIYIGQSVSNHQNYLGSGVALELAVKKYGKPNFSKEILEEGDFCIEKLNELEIHYIDIYNSTNKKIGYNICRGGGNNYQNHSNRKKEKPRPPMSEERKHAIATGIKKYWSNSVTRERESLNRSIRLKGRKVSEETRQKISKSNKGRKGSQEKIPTSLYTIKGEQLLNFESIVECASYLNVHDSNIVNCIKGKHSNCKGYVIVKRGDPFKYNEPDPRSSVKIEMVDRSGNLITKFKSKKEAYNYLGVSSHTFDRYLSGKRTRFNTDNIFRCSE